MTVNTLLEAFWTIVTVDQYTMAIVCTLVAAIVWLMKLILDSTALAILFAPVLLFSGLLANFIFKATGFAQTADKDTNVVIASSVGVFLALVVLLLLVWASVTLSNSKARRSRAST